MNKLYTIIISNVDEINLNNFLRYINTLYPEIIKIKEFYDAQFIAEGIGIGRYNDKIIIVQPNRIEDFFQQEPGTFEEKLCSFFPASKISVFMLYSVADIYGFAIINNGEKQRIKYGMGNEIFIDSGEKLELEYLYQEKGQFDIIEKLFINALECGLSLNDDVPVYIYK